MSTLTQSVSRPEPATAIATPAPAERIRRRRRGRRWLSPLLAVVVWQAASSTGVLPQRLLAAPLTVARAAGSLWRTGELQTALLVSVQRVAIGLAVGLTIGAALGLLAGLSRAGNELVDPILQMLRALPFFGLIPLLVLWLGIGEAPKITLVALGVVFPLYLNLSAAARGTDARYLELADSLGLRRWARIRSVILPDVLPSALVGLRQSLGVAWLALIVAEQVNANAGLGYLINNAREFLRTDVIVVGLVLYALLGLTTDWLVRQVERRALAWRRTAATR